MNNHILNQDILNNHRSQLIKLVIKYIIEGHIMRLKLGLKNIQIFDTNSQN